MTTTKSEISVAGNPGDATGNPDNAGAPATLNFLPRIAKGVIINLGGAMGRTVILFVYTLMLARMLPVDELGEYFLLFTIINILGLVATVGLDTGVVRYVAAYTGEGKQGLARRVLQVSLIIGVPIGVLFAAALVLLAPYARDLFFDGSDTAVSGLRIFALSVPLWVAARLYNAVTQGMHSMQYQVYSRDISEQFTKVAFSLVAIVAGFGLIGVVWANVFSMIIAMVMSLIFAMILLPRRPGPQPRLMEPAKRLVTYSLPLAFSNMLGMLLLYVDMLLLGYYSTTTDVGFYGAALRVGVVTSTLIMAFGTVFSPVISDLYNRHMMRELQALLKTVSRWIFLFNLPIFLILMLFPGSILRMFGGEFEASGSVLVVLALGQMINAVAGTAGFVVMMSGRSKLELLNVSSALVVNVALCVLLIPANGAIGAAVANMMTFVTVSFMRTIELWVIMRIHAFDRVFIKPALAGIAGLGSVLLAARFIDWSQTLAGVLILGSGLLLVYMLVMLALGLEEHDRAVLKMITVRLARRREARRAEEAGT